MDRFSKSALVGILAFGMLAGCSSENTNANKIDLEQTPGIITIEHSTIADPFKTSCKNLKREISKDILNANSAKNTAIASHMDFATQAYGTIAIAQYEESQSLLLIYNKKCLRDKLTQELFRR